MPNYCQTKLSKKKDLKNDLEIAKLKANLQFSNQSQSISNALFHETQFKIYNELWVSLTDLKINMDQLWEKCFESNFSIIRELLKEGEGFNNK
jgi:hypothetical protein